MREKFEELYIIIPLITCIVPLSVGLENDISYILLVSPKFLVKLNDVVLFKEFDESETPNRVSLSDITNTEEEVQIKPRKEIKNSSRVMRYFQFKNSTVACVFLLS